jgi:hypothetical protein
MNIRLKNKEVTLQNLTLYLHQSTAGKSKFANKSLKSKAFSLQALPLRVPP